MQTGRVSIHERAIWRTEIKKSTERVPSGTHLLRGKYCFDFEAVERHLLRRLSFWRCPKTGHFLFFISFFIFGFNILSICTHTLSRDWNSWTPVMWAKRKKWQKTKAPKTPSTPSTKRNRTACRILAYASSVPQQPKLKSIIMNPQRINGHRIYNSPIHMRIHRKWQAE